MTNLAATVRNNAAWCDAVARSHGGETTFKQTHWSNAVLSPPFYPNLITLTPDDTDAQLAAIRSLQHLEDEWGVKDSFAALDLGPLGFELLFSAQWLWREPAETPRLPPRWQKATNEPHLAAWEHGFSAGEEPLNLFRPVLLADPAIAFLGIWEKQSVTAGFALNKHEGVCAISNVFAPEKAGQDFLPNLVTTAAHFANGAPLTGYVPDAAVPEWQALGFQPIGPLRIWLKN